MAIKELCSKEFPIHSTHVVEQRPIHRDYLIDTKEIDIPSESMGIIIQYETAITETIKAYRHNLS